VLSTCKEDPLYEARSSSGIIDSWKPIGLHEPFAAKPKQMVHVGDSDSYRITVFTQGYFVDGSPIPRPWISIDVWGATWMVALQCSSSTYTVKMLNSPPAIVSNSDRERVLAGSASDSGCETLGENIYDTWNESPGAASFSKQMKRPIKIVLQART
jgi:hypothetical protein